MSSHQSTHSEIAMDLAAINDAVRRLEQGSIKSVVMFESERKKQNPTNSNALTTVISESIIASADFEDTEVSEHNEEIESDILDRKYGPETISFIVGASNEEMRMHKGLLKKSFRFRLFFPVDPTTDQIDATCIDIPIFSQVREWMYMGQENHLSIMHEIWALESYKTRSGIHVIIKYYILAQKLGIEWLQDVLIDFIVGGFYKLAIGGEIPNLREVEYVYLRTGEHCCLRDYMALAMQYLILAGHPAGGPSTQELLKVLRKVPELQVDFFGKTRGIANKEHGTLALPKLEEFLVCTFHLHVGDSNCHAQRKDISQLEWFSEPRRGPTGQEMVALESVIISNKSVGKVPAQPSIGRVGSKSSTPCNTNTASSIALGKTVSQTSTTYSNLGQPSKKR